MSDTPFTLVEERSALEALAAEMERSSWHALDTEANSGFAYRERLCLLQVNVAGSLWLVDLLAFPAAEAALEPLRRAIEEEDRYTLLHGGEFDVGCLKRDYGVHAAGVWDSQQAASFLGWPRTGYGAVVERTCGVALDKQFSHYDWGRRPLPAEVLEYALDDVRYLPKVCQELRERVAAADLEDELAIANRAVEEATWDGGYRPDGFWKIKGVGKLPAGALPFLAALWEWRDGVAREADRAPGRMLNNRVLLALSRNPPRDERSLRRLGLPGRLRASHGRELLDLLAGVRRQAPPPPARPVSPGEGEHGADRSVRGRETRLKRWRQAEAERRGVPLQVVLPSRALEHLKRLGAADLESVPQLGAKRIRLYGTKLRELAPASAGSDW